MTPRPDLPYGYDICAYTPANVTATGGSEGVLQQSFPDWKVKEYVGDDDDFLYYKFTEISGTDTFWAWPIEVDCSSSGSSKTPTESTTAAKVRDIQKKLNIKYTKHANYPLTVDGKFGPKTCAAAYGYQKDVNGYSGGTLLGPFFTTLGLPEVWTTHFKNSCLSWYGDVPAPEPTPKPEPTPEPVPVAKPFPWKLMLVGAAGGSLIGLAGQKTVLRNTKVKAWQAGVGGALLGAVGGLIAGKVGQ
jgi:peptidoglycan hydrolase-like protein with peptidoglycan-binding domain